MERKIDAFCLSTSVDGIAVTELLQRVEPLATAYGEAVRTLRQYVEDMQDGINKNSPDVNSLSFPYLSTGSLQPIKVLSEGTLKFEDLKIGLIYPGIFGATKVVLGHRARLSQRYPGLLLEMALIYRVALFEAFITDVISAVLVSRPEILKSNKKMITHEELIDGLADGTLLDVLVQKEVIEFSYLSLERQDKWAAEKLGVEFLSRDPTIRASIFELSARRNLFVHNNGVVNSIYHQVVSEPHYDIGYRLEVDNEYWNNADSTLIVVAEHLVRSVVTKFCPGSDVPSIGHW